MPVKFKLKGIDRVTAALSSLPLQTQGGVKVIGEVNYIKAMVWDLGYVTRTIKPGPKTMWSVNVYGDPKVLTITAPTGFIRVNRNVYRTIIRAEFKKTDFAHTPSAQWPKLIETMMRNAAEQFAEVVKAAAPIDTGELRDSIQPAYPDDGVFTSSLTTGDEFDIF